MTELDSKTHGTLYVVGTPIGNLKDITLRALEILKSVDLIAAEDTRHTKKLLTHYEIHNKLVSLNADAERGRTPWILSFLTQGRDVAVVTDAGTPAGSDPGGALVSAARALGFTVTPAPGPSAITAALSVSGITGFRFTFEGFLPRASEKRRRRIRALMAEDKPVLLFESPQRVTKTLTDFFEAAGDRTVSVHRELTKVFEENLTVSLRDVAEKRITLPDKGEYTLIIFENKVAAETPQSIDAMDVSESLDVMLDLGLSVRDAVDAVSRILRQPRGEVYRAAKEKT